jgi:hypothetical protein
VTELILSSTNWVQHDYPAVLAAEGDLIDGALQGTSVGLTGAGGFCPNRYAQLLVIHNFAGLVWVAGGRLHANVAITTGSSAVTMTSTVGPESYPAIEDTTYTFNAPSDEYPIGDPAGYGMVKIFFVNNDPNFWHGITFSVRLYLYVGVPGWADKGHKFIRKGPPNLGKANRVPLASIGKIIRIE